MRTLKRLFLGPYYYATTPYRLLSRRQAIDRGLAPVAVVYYHRIADDRANGWTLDFDTFRRQIQWLQSNFDLVSLEEAQRRIRSDRNARPTVSVTFDDGYSENCDRALPLLVEAGVPCTYFVTTDNALTGEPFPHDVAGGHRFAPNTVEQLKWMVRNGIEIGGHTRTHANLGAKENLDELFDEVVRAGRELSEAVEAPARYFAFPFGRHENLHPEAFFMAREAGYEAVCSAYGGYNLPGDDPFHLQRIGGEGPLLRLKSWLTFDPWKLRSVRRYDYRAESARRGAPLPVGQ